MTVTVDRHSHRVTAREFYHNLYSPIFISVFEVVEEHETPLFNRLRLWLGLDSAKKHTTIVHTTTYSGSMNSTTTRKEDYGPSTNVISTLESKGYEVLSHDEAIDRYSDDQLPVMIRAEKRSRQRKDDHRKWVRDDIERRREIHEERGHPVENCPECCGFIVPNEDAQPSNGEKLILGMVVEHERHMPGCELSF